MFHLLERIVQRTPDESEALFAPDVCNFKAFEEFLRATFDL